eukprot:9130148-Ditylum_brightwellii.AAC.1
MRNTNNQNEVERAEKRQYPVHDHKIDYQSLEDKLQQQMDKFKKSMETRMDGKMTDMKKDMEKMVETAMIKVVEESNKIIMVAMEKREQHSITLQGAVKS